MHYLTKCKTITFSHSIVLLHLLFTKRHFLFKSLKAYLSIIVHVIKVFFVFVLLFPIAISKRTRLITLFKGKQAHSRIKNTNFKHFFILYLISLLLRTSTSSRHVHLNDATNAREISQDASRCVTICSTLQQRECDTNCISPNFDVCLFVCL